MTDRSVASDRVRPQPMTVPRAAANAAERFGDRVAFGVASTESGASARLRRWASSWTNLRSDSSPSDSSRVTGSGILADTRPEWTFASLAISRAGGVVVPVYPTDSPEQCEWVAGNSEARMFVCEDWIQADKIAQVRERLPSLDQVIVIDPVGVENAISFDGLRDGAGAGTSSDELERRCEAVSADDTYIIIYTSGTTGSPKGVVLTHANCVAVGVVVREVGFLDEGDVSYLYLPLAHAFALMVQLATFALGSSIVYFGGDTKQIVAELMEAKATFVPSVPRIFEKIYALAAGAAPGQAGLRRAVDLGMRVRGMQQRGEEVPADLRRAFEKADEALYRNVRGLFGGRVKQGVSGAAPIAPGILEFFYACGVPVLEGWDDGDDRRRLREHPRSAPPRDGRPAASRRGDQGHRRRRAIDLRTERLPGVLAQPGGDRRSVTADGWLRTGGSGRDRCGRLRLDHRGVRRTSSSPPAARTWPPAEPGERPPAVAVDLAGRHVRGPSPLPRRADQPRRGGDPAVGARARAARRHPLARSPR